MAAKWYVSLFTTAAIALGAVSALLFVRPVLGQTFQYDATTLIGDWQLQDTRKTGAFLRQSGQEGDIRFFLAPLSNDRDLNGRFFLTCTPSAFFLDVNLPVKDLKENLGSQQAKIFLNGHELGSTEGLSADKVVENGMVKTRIDSSILDSIFAKGRISLGLRDNSSSYQYDYHLNNSTKAVDKFVSECSSSK